MNLLHERRVHSTKKGVNENPRAQGAASKVLDGAPAELVYPKVDAIITAPDFSALGAVYLSMDAFGAEKEDEEFCDDGSVHVQVREGVVHSHSSTCHS